MKAPTLIFALAASFLLAGAPAATTMPSEYGTEVLAETASTNCSPPKTAPKPRKKNDKPLAFVFKKTGEKAVIPLYRAGAHILVRASVNGQDAGYFLADTGAYCNVLSTAAARQLGLEETGQWHIAGFGGSDKAGICKVDSLSLGDLELQNHSLTVYHLGGVGEEAGLPMSGLLGAILWGRLPFTIDYRNATITFYPAETFEPPPQAHKEQLKVINGHPAVKCRLDDKTDGWFLLDTGADGHVSVDEPYLKEHPELLAGRKLKATMVHGIVGAETRLDARLASFEIFGDKWTGVPASFQPVNDPKQADAAHMPLNEAVVGLVGEGILRHYRLTFDYINHQIWSEKVPDESAEDLRKRLTDPNVKDLAGYTPLMVAILHEDDKIVEALLAMGADLEAQDRLGGTALLCAIRVNRPDLVKQLLTRGARIEAKKPRIPTPMDLAILSGNLEIVQILLSKGAGIPGTDDQGWSPLFKAVLSGEPAMVQFFLGKGQVVNAQDSKGFTPLMLAAVQGREEVVKLLLDRGAQVNTKNKEGLSALDLATRLGHTRIVQMLQKDGPGKAK
jgi:ankyrin repeat protein